MRNWKTWLGVVLALIVWSVPPVSAQTNPCTAPPPTTVAVNPSTIIAALPDHTTRVAGHDTEFLVTSYEERIYELSKDPAVDPPFATVEIPRSAFTLIAGTTDCYQATGLAFPITPNLVYKSTLVAVANPVANVANSAASEATNPFAKQGPPRAPLVPRVQP